MAIINITFDTKTKKIEASIDGASLPNVEGISLYRKYDYDKDQMSEEFMCSIQSCEAKDEEGYKNYTAIMAKEGIETVDSKTNSKLVNDISEFMRHRRRR